MQGAAILPTAQHHPLHRDPSRGSET